MFCRYMPKVRADIAKYACQHGTQVSSAYFSRKLGRKVSQQLSHSIKLVYLKCMKDKREDSSDEEIAKLLPKKLG